MRSPTISNMPSKRAIRIGNVSGATGDAPHAMLRMARTGNVDVITGDWLSEMNIAWNAITKAENPELGYEVGFLDQLEESIDSIVEKKVKVITNAGALNTPALAKRVEELCLRKGYGKTAEKDGIVVASVLGDDVSSLVAGGKLDLQHLDHGEKRLSEWALGLKPTCAAAYIGAWGVVEALKAGADIVICGRVTDASPVVSLTRNPARIR